MSNEQKGADLLAQADKKLRSFSLFNATGKYEDASDLYLKAANFFKLAKKCKFKLVYSVLLIQL